jgi:hypothetical protein
MECDTIGNTTPRLQQTAMLLLLLPLSQFLCRWWCVAGANAVPHHWLWQHPGQ